MALMISSTHPGQVAPGRHVGVPHSPVPNGARQAPTFGFLLVLQDISASKLVNIQTLEKGILLLFELSSDL